MFLHPICQASGTGLLRHLIQCLHERSKMVHMSPQMPSDGSTIVCSSPYFISHIHWDGVWFIPQRRTNISLNYSTKFAALQIFIRTGNAENARRDPEGDIKKQFGSAVLNFWRGSIEA
jgi:hypothetical protein